jgi:hypothetical protein
MKNKDIRKAVESNEFPCQKRTAGTGRIR